MTAIPTFVFEWDGDSMVPRHPRLADRHYVVGETYALEVREQRSSRSARHYFAVIHEAWTNLPEAAAERFPTSEHLRKYALIRAGYRNERSIACASKAEAQRVRAFVKPMDEFAVITLNEAVVTVYTAKSQSVRAMPKGEFQQSKDAVLDFIASLIGTSSGDLSRHASEAA